MHQVVSTIYHLFWAKMPSQQSISQKKPWLEIGNRPFFPLHQTTHSVNLLTVGLPPLYWLDTGWWCSDHGVIIPLLFFFFFSFYYCWSTLSHSTPASFLPMLILYGGWHGLIGLAPLLPLLGPVGLPVVTSCWAGPLGLISFSLSFRAFIVLCFYHCLLISFLHLSLLVTGLSAVGPFFNQNGYQHTLGAIW